MRAGKQRANMVLAVVFGLFVVALALRYRYPGNELTAALLTVTEASLAGGVADWFAVTALFRKPFGFPYHTALVPRNRERIIEALTRAIEQDFLSKESIKARLDQVNMLDKLIVYAKTYDVRTSVRSAINKLLAELGDTIDPSAVGKYGERLLKVMLKRHSVAPHASALFRWVLQEERGEELYTAVVKELAVMVRQDKIRNIIYNYLEQLKQKTAQKNWLSSVITGLMESIDGINLDDAAAVLHQELIRTVDELVEAEHPVRLWFQDELKDIAQKLEMTEWETMVNDWKDGQLARFALAEPLTVLAEAVLAALKQPSSYRNSVNEWLIDQMEGYWKRFKESAALQSQAETYLKTLLVRIIDQEHSLVGKVASSALHKLSDEGLIEFIEDKAGDDLDWIRINGVIVGGGAGLVLAGVRLLVQ